MLMKVFTDSARYNLSIKIAVVLPACQVSQAGICEADESYVNAWTIILGK